MGNHYFSRFVLHMVKGWQLQLRCCSPLFYNFRQFNVKTTHPNHPINQEMGELLAKGAIEPCTGGAMYIPTFKMHTIRQVWLLNKQGEYVFSVVLKDAYLHIPIVKHHCHFLLLFGTTNFINRRFCHWG